MTKYVFDVPDENQPIGDVYYPDERDAPMPVERLSDILGSGECETISMDCFGNPPFNQTGLNGNSTACGCSE